MPATFDVRLDVTTDASGDGTDTATIPVNAFLYKIHFADGDLANSHTAVLSVTDTPGAVDETIWSTTAADTDSDVWVEPLIQNVDPSNDAISGQYNYILVTGKPLLTIAAGGDEKSGYAILHFLNA